MLIGKLISIHSKDITRDTIIFLPRYSFHQLVKGLKSLCILIHILYIRNKLCSLPYKQYKKCKNYNNKPLCPPHTPPRLDIIDKYDFFKLVYIVFDFKQYKESMKKENPDWTDGRIACNLYYQNQLKALLKEDILKNYKYAEIFGCGSGFLNSPSMEGIGINAFSTLRKNGIYPERIPTTKIILTCLLVSKKIFSKSIQKTII